MRPFATALFLPALLAAAADAGEITLAPQPFFVSHTFGATALPAETTAIRLPAEVWSDFEIQQILAHGSKVAAGDTLVKFDPEGIDKKLADTRRAFATSELTLAQAQLSLKTLKESTPLKLEAARRAARNAKEELDYFTNIRRKAAEEGAEQGLKHAVQSLENAQEELRQLKKMYDADDLTEETEEIILVRQKDAVARAEFGLRMEKLDFERTMKVVLPRQAETLADAAKDAAIALAAAEEELPRGLKLAEMALQTATVNFTREKDDLAKLEADRKLFEIKAPAAGWFYYGTIEDGRWTTGETIKGLVVNGKAPLKRPFATFIPATARLDVVAFVDEATSRALAPELKGKATLPGREQPELPATLLNVSPTPATDGRYRANFELAWPKDLTIVPGATAEITVVSYQQPEALAVPTKALTQTATGWNVEVKLADGKSERRAVKRGRSSKEQTEILSGLEAGQVVIVP
jgi:multidrug resistance efflux pump